MEKTTKKKKKTKSLRRRIGIIAVGGLSLVMTVCLSVGATLAWFAGSTWSDQNMYMGGPVYIEMAGRGASAGTAGDGEDTAKWMGGTGSLDIKASTARDTGTAVGVNAAGKKVDASGRELTADELKTINNNVLLPGQKFEIYSQARVYSTATTTTVADTDTASNSSGANVTNKSGNGMAYHKTSDGRVTTTTTSVIRARFSISIEFDPSVGFANFTDESYMTHYPVQSTKYTGDGLGGSWGDTDTATEGVQLGWVENSTPQPWSDALVDNTGKYDGDGNPTAEYKAFTTVNETDGDTTHSGRRDYVDVEGMDVPFTATQDANTKTTTGAYAGKGSADDTDLEKIQKGQLKSIYSWKYVSKATYYSSALTVQAVDNGGATEETFTPGTATSGEIYVQMGAPFDGSDKTSNANGYYGVWVLTADRKGYQESDAFYKARCNAYLQTYVEEFRSEYGNIETKTISDSIKSLESELNQSFVNLVNDSSDDIIAGYTNGFTVNDTTGAMEPIKLKADGTTAAANDGEIGQQYKHNASWLYIDPTIGNDTNTSEISTSTGGWWYLVACDSGSVVNKSNIVRTGADSVSGTLTTGDNPATVGKTETEYVSWNGTSNTITYSAAGTAYNPGADAEHPAEFVPGKPTADTGVGFKREQFSSTDRTRLHAMLYEVKPDQLLTENVGKNKTTNVQKIVSNAFPFVNGSSAIPGDALTNVFANAKISFQISFQAIQAFLPFSTSIDKMDYTNPLLGTAKALTIKNAIPVFNEAFDYQETGATSSTISGL